MNLSVKKRKIALVETQISVKIALVGKKPERIEEDSLDLIPSPSPSGNIQIFVRKVYLR
jgi:hypothetical protein